MILIDHRRGSKELIPYLKPFGPDVEESVMEFGDIKWVGEGPDGPVMVGVERKRINDLVQSMRDRRLAGHQLPGLLRDYQYCYLLIEGHWKPGRQGELLTSNNGWKWWPAKGQVMYREVAGFLSSLSLRAANECGRVLVEKTVDIEESATLLFNLYQMWQKPWAKHTAHKQIYAPVPERKGKVEWGTISPQLKLARAVAAQLPGLDQKAFKVADHFGTAGRIMRATERQWVDAKVGVGKDGARKILDWLWGSE